MPAPMPTAAHPVQDPRFPGVQYTGDWGPTHPWHPVDGSLVRTPQDFVAQVDGMGEWASAEDKARAAEIRREPGSFIVTNGIVQPKPSWLARNGPKLALFAVGALATAGIANAAMAGGAATSAGTGATAATTAATGATTAGATGAAATTGAGMAAKGGFFHSLGHFFNSPGGQLATDLAGKVAGNVLDNRATNHGLDLQNQYNTDALNFLKTQDARDYAEYLKERDRTWAQTDVDRQRAEEDRQLKLLREGQREGRLAPFRDGAANGYKALSSLLTLPQGGGVYYPPSVGPARAPQLADLLRG